MITSLFTLMLSNFCLFSFIIKIVKKFQETLITSTTCFNLKVKFCIMYKIKFKVVRKLLLKSSTLLSFFFNDVYFCSAHSHD